jgi:hypothetical protein
MWFPKRDAAEEERRREPLPLKRRHGILEVGGEVVIKGDRGRKALATAPLPYGVEELGRRNHAIASSEMAKLPAQHIARDGGEDLEVGVACGVADAVVHERDPRASRGNACTPAGEKREYCPRRVLGGRHAMLASD